ncbi:MAG TPA: hypothetical protein VGY57_05850, partial [Vicinamibacterales bacterium]|nr:hypothetical protein [Vicinamibacterales bacterium]
MTACVLRVDRQDLGGSVYRFGGARGAVRWPTAAGAGLGRAGCWNFLVRVGVSPAEVDWRRLRSLPSGTIVFISLDGVVEDEAERAIRERIDSGGTIVAEGDPAAWSHLFPELFRGRSEQLDNPYAALGYALRDRTELIAPPRWPFFAFDALDAETRAVGRVVAISGERQTPSRAIVAPQPLAPAVVRWRSLVFLNGSPFRALQSWLQGQEDLQPWLQWRHRLFWLDEWTSAIRALLIDCGVALPSEASSAFAPFGSTTV